ncbi:hypothetical protein UFOVP1165_46 [uncultured Caudovirales phage]|uniref:Uncharacterized protein n=1 Tax=uncultured Caudovirales phage TaxID=2100421 RepID=A0A6J5QUD6_9CAUD|nr:hypothetical protein UFOVP1165_46 [uncultured Caudovirales phage]
MDYQSFTSPADPYAEEQARVQQKMLMAQMLQRQAMEQPQGQMVSGHYVPTSITQNLARLASGYLGRKGQEKAMESSAALSNQKLMDQSGEMARILAEPDIAKRASMAMQSPLPGVQALGNTFLAEQLKRDGLAQKVGMEPPPTRTVRRGNQDVTEQFNRATGAYEVVGSGDAFRSDVMSQEAMAQKEKLANIRGAAQGGSGQEYMSFIPTPGGVVGAYNKGPRIGQSQMLTNADGTPYIKSSDSPELQGEIAGAKTSATVTADATANARLDLPKVEAQAKYATGLIDKALKHPGLSAVVGVPGITNFLPGTDAQGFKAILAQIKGKQFLQAFESLKGAGQITEIEGQKATEAEARMSTAQSEKEFKSALKEYKTVIKSLSDRVKEKAGMSGAGGNNPGTQNRIRYDANGEVIP